MNLDFYAACQDIDEGRFSQSVFDEVVAGTISSQYKREFELRNHQELTKTCDQVISVLKKYGCRVTKIHLSCQQFIVPIFDRKNSLASQLKVTDIESFSKSMGLLHHRFEYDLIGNLYVLFDRSIEYTMLTSSNTISPYEGPVGSKTIECSWHVKVPSI